MSFIQHKAVLAAAVLLIAPWAGCDDDDDDTADTTGTTTTTPQGAQGNGDAGPSETAGAGGANGSASTEGGAGGSAGSSGDAGSESEPGLDTSVELTDPEAVQVLETVNQGEIMQGQLATMRATDARVTSYATLMVGDHTSASAMLTTVATAQAITPAESDTSNQLMQAGDATLRTLRTTDSAGFDLAYMNAQVMQHAQVLELLDRSLVRNIDNRALQGQARAARDMVAEHLKQGQDLVDELNMMQ